MRIVLLLVASAYLLNTCVGMSDDVDGGDDYGLDGYDEMAESETMWDMDSEPVRPSLAKKRCSCNRQQSQTERQGSCGQMHPPVVLPLFDGKCGTADSPTPMMGPLSPQDQMLAQSSPGQMPQTPGQPPVPGQMPQTPGQPPLPGQMPQTPGQPPLPGQMQSQMPGQPPVPGQMQSQMPGQPPVPGQPQAPTSALPDASTPAQPPLPSTAPGMSSPQQPAVSAPMQSQPSSAQPPTPTPTPAMPTPSPALNQTSAQSAPQAPASSSSMGPGASSAHGAKHPPSPKTPGNSSALSNKTSASPSASGNSVSSRTSSTTNTTNTNANANTGTNTSASGSAAAAGGKVSITQKQFTDAVTSCGFPAPAANKYAAFVQGIPKSGITSLRELAMFLANILHESDGLKDLSEIQCAVDGCKGKYDAAPNGVVYFGRGYIQLTDGANYKAASKDLYGSEDKLASNPEIVAKDENIAWDTSFWYWKTRVHSAAGISEGKFGASIKAINGAIECGKGPNPQAQQRFEYYGKVLKAFGATDPPIESGCYN